MAPAQAAKLSISLANKGTDRRRHQRVRVNILGRFMLENRQEYPCQVINMSPGGMAMITPVAGRVGEKIVAYLDHIGRVEGRIAREIEGGFAVELNATPRRRDKLASVLTWLANRHELNLPEDRRHERFVPKNPVTRIVLPDGTAYMCRILDVSLSGAALSCPARPPIGTELGMGKMRARVVRHLEDGIAVEFAVIQNRALLEQHISGEDTTPAG
ncbi:PilZ domain-containing protein [Microvirga tunisiensis]|uniref:PilZ domain-containing protein n=2 Tax=Pannonibacter tanglangensis TaxID=2750084 RepID=A0A7X5F021_9HYPH|nr:MULTISPECIES: PilZ domain-containing protein [unclassified Pannonibacter]NBN63639.1 PilZ domain-containing protein [Pannonibacter sp. XCT-34]NBN77273.1 PilZ domain-containing protein [Pannonibacter sp. XCT-53]